MKRSRLSIVLITLAASSLLGACADSASDQVVTELPGQENVPGPDSGNPDAQPGDRFLTISLVGGLNGPSDLFARTPIATVYADGTVFAQGAVPLIYPGPATTPLTTGRLNADQLATITQTVEETGLTTDPLPDPGEEVGLNDASSTRFSVIVDGQERIVEAYALGFDEADGTNPLLTAAQQEVRNQLAALLTQVSDLVNMVATDSYQPTGYAILSQPVGISDQTVAPNQLDWPAGVPEPTETDCVALLNDHAETFAALLPQATQITQWNLTDRVVNLVIRPLLPDETTC